MNRSLKIGLMVLLGLMAVGFGWQFKARYDRVMARRASAGDTDLVNVPVPDSQGQAVAAPQNERLGWFIGGLVLSAAGFGLLLAHEVAQYLGSRAIKALYNDEGEGIASPDYEIAENEWAAGNHLDAIRLMREYLAKNPREQHVALRIAEIYEKDLNNPLAAALEYEEVLKQKLPPERWGWAAIHLSNLYTGKLNQMDKSVELLRRLDADFPDTAAAEKARARLAQLEEEGMIPPSAPEAPAAEAPPAADPGPRLPPGFHPKKS